MCSFRGRFVLGRWCSFGFVPRIKLELQLWFVTEIRFPFNHALRPELGFGTRWRIDIVLISGQGRRLGKDGRDVIGVETLCVCHFRLARVPEGGLPRRMRRLGSTGCCTQRETLQWCSLAQSHARSSSQAL